VDFSVRTRKRWGERRNEGARRFKETKRYTTTCSETRRSKASSPPGKQRGAPERKAEGEAEAKQGPQLRAQKGFRETPIVDACTVSAFLKCGQSASEKDPYASAFEEVASQAYCSQDLLRKTWGKYEAGGMTDIESPEKRGRKHLPPECVFEG